MPRKKASDVTLICVAGVDRARALNALIRSTFKVNFEKVVLVTTKIKPITLGKFSIQSPFESRLDSYREYNRYVVYSLHKHVETNFCLIVQGDGYVLNGSLWSDDFKNYDYIGAPWPLEENRYIDPFGNHQQVGNGGFSLRSKKLLTVPLFFDVVWEVNQGNFYKHFNHNSYSEDGVICVHNRHIYLQAGCVFAPIEIAIRFSRELPILGIQIDKTFGFHRYKRGGLLNLSIAFQKLRILTKF